MPTTPKATPKSTANYRFVGDHATEIEIGDTRPWLEPGEFVDLSGANMNDPKIQEMIETGVLVDTSLIVPDPLTVEEQAAQAAETTEAAPTTNSVEGGS